MKKLFSYYKVLLVAVMAVTMVATFSDSIASADHVSGDGVVCDASTDHCYLYVADKTSWSDANDAAALLEHNGVTGHLATMESTAETNFIVSDVPAAVVYHGGGDGGYEGGAWLGAVGTSTDLTPGNTTDNAFSYIWAWENGDVWSYENFASGEPNWGDTAIHFWHNGVGNWNNAPPAQLKGYLVEFDAPPAVAQSATFLGGVLGDDPVGTTQDTIVEYFNADLGQWQPAYLVGDHPWGYIPGTDSWINCGPTLSSPTGVQLIVYGRQRFTVSPLMFLPTGRTHLWIFS